jgi:hypothetical protein
MFRIVVLDGQRRMLVVLPEPGPERKLVETLWFIAPGEHRHTSDYPPDWHTLPAERIAALYALAAVEDPAGRFGGEVPAQARLDRPALRRGRRKSEEQPEPGHPPTSAPG